MNSEQKLKNKILKVLESQGFKINPKVVPSKHSKAALKRVQSKSRLEQIGLHKTFILDNLNLVKAYSRNYNEIVPNNISLELREIRSESKEEILFRWWNFIWWSIPYQRSYGRQMRFFLWDKAHDAPFGMICLQSPVLKMAVRDQALGIPNNELNVWVNKSLNAQRVGALPPYNDLIGGKMVARTLGCNEVRIAYKRNYKNYKTLIEGINLKPELLFITTSSAFGRSSIYNRLKYKNEYVGIKLGYTKGSGTFHIPESIYLELLEYLNTRGVNVERGYGNGPSRKLKLISMGLGMLGLREFEFHGIKREYYLFPHTRNLTAVIQRGQKPVWNNRPFEMMADYWMERWAIPRLERTGLWSRFNRNLYFRNTLRQINSIN